MKRALWTSIFAILIVGAASAVEIQLKDGTIISADSYKLTGSYLMLQMPDGRHVAYDVADVDLDALRAAEAATSSMFAAAASVVRKRRKVGRSPPPRRGPLPAFSRGVRWSSTVSG